jgi:hypothetical protein
MDISLDNASRGQKHVQETSCIFIAGEMCSSLRKVESVLVRVIDLELELC